MTSTYNIAQVATDALSPLFISDPNANQFNMLHFFLPGSRSATIQPQSARKVFSGFSATSLPQSTGIQLLQTPQTIKKGLHMMVDMVTGVGQQIGAVFHNTTKQRIHLQGGCHFMKGILKQISQDIPLIALLKKNRVSSFKSKPISKKTSLFKQRSNKLNMLDLS